jgi:hypothetical protein
MQPEGDRRMSPLFLEERRPSPIFVWVMMAIVFGILLVIDFLVPTLGMGWFGQSLTFLFFVCWIRVTFLRLAIVEDELQIRFSPFPTYRLALKEIQRVEVHMTYPWGKRWGWAYKRSMGVRVFLAGSAPGLLIHCKSKEVLWVSTQCPEELAAKLS